LLNELAVEKLTMISLRGSYISLQKQQVSQQISRCPLFETEFKTMAQALCLQRACAYVVK
jgi:hypothetical protein